MLKATIFAVGVLVAGLLLYIAVAYWHERAHAPAETPAGGTGRWGGTVTETMDASGYTYVQVDTGFFEVQPSDAYLLCSDGLHGHVSDEQIAHQLRTAHSSAHVCEALVQAAKDDGGTDNITVVVARIDEVETLRLGDPHERAVFRRSDGFAGRWIAP